MWKLAPVLVLQALYPTDRGYGGFLRNYLVGNWVHRSKGAIMRVRRDPGPFSTVTREPRECESSEPPIGSDTNADTNPYEQPRTHATGRQEKYPYLQGFLNTDEQPRHPRPAIPLIGVSRVRIPPPPLSFTIIRKASAENLASIRGFRNTGE
jgi:hypothetical protein